MKKLGEYRSGDKVQAWVRDAWNESKGEWKPAEVIRVSKVLPQRGPEYDVVEIEVERKYYTENTGYFAKINRELVIYENEIKEDESNR